MSIINDRLDHPMPPPGYVSCRCGWCASPSQPLPKDQIMLCPKCDETPIHGDARKAEELYYAAKVAGVVLLVIVGLWLAALACEALLR